MNPSQLFSGRAYVFNSERKLSPKDSHYDLVCKVLSQSLLKLKPDTIIDVGGNENFDEFKITSEDLMYTLKLSLDEDCEILKSEIDFLKSNKSPIIPTYYDSGVARIGMPIMFLLSSYENGFSIDDFGISSVVSNCDSFLYTLKRFNSLKSSNTFDDYLDKIFTWFSTKESSQFLEKSISSFHNMDEINNVFKLLEQEAKNLSSSIKIDKDCCHGNLCKENLVTKYGLYKTKNTSFTFMGDALFDLSFFCVSSGFSLNMSLFFLKKYCELNSLDFAKEKPNFDLYNKVSCCVFYSKIFFEFLVEESIFVTSRPEKLVESSIKISSSFARIKSLSCGSEISKTIQKIITRPITQKRHE